MIETLLDTYAPIQKLTKAELELKSKPWLTKGIMKASFKKKFIKTRNSAEKNIYIMNSNTIEILSLN